MCFILRLNLLYLEIKYKLLELKIMDIKNCDLLSQLDSFFLFFSFLLKSLIKVNSSKLNEISLQVAARLVRVGKVMEVLVEGRLGMNGKWKIYSLKSFGLFCIQDLQLKFCIYVTSNGLRRTHTKAKL